MDATLFATMIAWILVLKIYGGVAGDFGMVEGGKALSSSSFLLLSVMMGIVVSSYEKKK